MSYKSFILQIFSTRSLVTLLWQCSEYPYEKLALFLHVSLTDTLQLIMINLKAQNETAVTAVVVVEPNGKSQYF